MVGLQVNWSVPQSDLQILGYSVRFQIANRGGDWLVRSTVSTEVLLQNLSPCTEYEFQVSATSVLGAGAWSSSVFKENYCGKLCMYTDGVNHIKDVEEGATYSAPIRRIITPPTLNTKTSV